MLGGARELAGPALHPAYRDAYAAIAADPNQLLAVAELDGDIIGTLQLSFIPGISLQGAWRGEIEGVRIRSGQRGRAWGTAMLTWAVDQCRDRDCRVVQLTTNAARHDAQRFYENNGFERSHVGFKLRL